MADSLRTQFENATGNVRGQNFRDLDVAEESGPEDVTFTKCDFSAAKFNGSNLSGLTFVDCIFQKTEFTGARLHSTTFVSCTRFEGACFEGAQADEAVFLNCDLENLRASRAKFTNTGFDKTSVRGADFEGADLSGYIGLVTDNTKLRYAKLVPPKPKGMLDRFFKTYMEPWRSLRSRYTGLNLFLSVLPALVYVLTLFIGAFTEAAAAILIQDNPATFLKSCVLSSEACPQIALWRIMVGQGQSLAAQMFIWLALAHNGFRFWVTLRVDALSREEDINAVTPSKDDYLGLLTIGKGLLVTQHIMLILFAVNITTLLGLGIPVYQQS